MRRTAIHTDQLQLITDGVVTTPQQMIRSGHVYICASEYGTFKPGQTTRGHKGIAERAEAHRKSEPTMHTVCAVAVDNARAREAALMLILKPYRIAGKEWFELTHHSAGQTITYMQGLGADTTTMQAEFLRVLTYRAHRIWTGR